MQPRPKNRGFLFYAPPVAEMAYAAVSKAASKYRFESCRADHAWAAEMEGRASLLKLESLVWPLEVRILPHAPRFSGCTQNGKADTLRRCCVVVRLHSAGPRLSEWRNWQTRQLEGLVGSGSLQVQLLSRTR
jgi:hypothetical protein